MNVSDYSTVNILHIPNLMYLRDMYNKGNSIWKGVQNMKKVLIILLCMCIIVNGLSLAAATIEPEQQGIGSNDVDVMAPPETSIDSITYYATGGGKYYHAIDDCSGINNPSVYTEKEAVSRGKKACPRCIGSNDVDVMAPPETSIDSITYYATSGGLWYHAIDDCNGMQNPSVFTEKEAVSLGKKACPHCIGSNDVDGIAVPETYIIQSGDCGKNVTWQLDSAGVLTISGTGRMQDFNTDSFSLVPWINYTDPLSYILVEYSSNEIEELSPSEIAGLATLKEPSPSAIIEGFAIEELAPSETVEYFIIEELSPSDIPDYSEIEEEIVTFNGIPAEYTGEMRDIIIDLLFGPGNYDYEPITKVIIEEGVTTIGDSAFEDLDSLTSITIPDSVTAIGHYAFYGCKKLNTIIIPDSVTSIGHYAFYGCKKLNTIIIPDSVTSIGGMAFEDCANTLTVYGTAGSYAEMYAHAYGYSFVER